MPPAPGLRGAGEVLKAVLDQNLDIPEFRQAVARQEWMEVELERIEAGIVSSFQGSRSMMPLVRRSQRHPRLAVAAQWIR
jgi:hypothetical protein